MKIAGWLAVLALVLPAAPAFALEIAKVRANRLRFEPEKGETFAVDFRTTGPARVTLDVYDGRDRRIRQIATEGELAAGDHTLAWDGRDARGAVVPPEAYHYTLVASPPSGDPVVYDLTDTTGGEMLTAGAVAYDAKTKAITYVIPELARVNVRVGLSDGGPLLGTIVDWVPREAGQRAEPWNGKDASGVLDVAAHPALSIVVNAFGLPQNTVLVGNGTPPEVRLADLPADAPARPNARKRPRRHGDYPAQPIETRQDVTIELALGGEVERNADGLPLVTGPVALRMTVPDAKEAERILAERFETTFFLDGQYRFENEAGFLPATWLFDPSDVSPGVHYVTGNLLGYEGHFGIATLAVEVRRESNGETSR